jgi:hypothetical protein
MVNFKFIISNFNSNLNTEFRIREHFKIHIFLHLSFIENLEFEILNYIPTLYSLFLDYRSLSVSSCCSLPARYSERVRARRCRG